MTVHSRGRRSLFLALGLLVYSAVCLAQLPGARERAAAVPRVPLAELLRRGAAGSDYVTVTDVALCKGGFAFWRDAMSPGDVDVFAPVYPASEETEPAPERLEALLEVQDATEWERIRRSEVFEVTAQVGREMAGIDRWARDYLAQRYVGLRWEGLTLLITGVHEPTANKARSLLVHGVASAVAGAVILLLRRIARV